jgi:hypothetical protein
MKLQERLVAIARATVKLTPPCIDFPVRSAWIRS